MAKQNETKNKVGKNPLSIALGSFFSRERSLQGETSKDIARKIGIGESFYRMIESGLANLHPSRVFKTINAFHNVVIEFDALCKYLVAVQLVEISLDSYEKLKLAFDELSTDKKLEKLLKMFKPALKNIKSGSVDLKVLFDTEVFHNEMREFFTNYEYYASSTTEVSEVKKQNINSIFEKLPTIYFDYVEDFIDRTQELPIRIVFSDLWKWEDKNKQNFKTSYCISKSSSSVISYQNLERYKYRYLWENQFMETNFIFLEDNMSINFIEKEFHKNLKKSLTNSSEDAMLQDFNNKVKKVNFKICSQKDSEANKLLISSDLDNENELRNYDAVWVFTMVNNNNIGFIATIDNSNNKLIEGISLTHSETTEKLNKMKALWEKLS